MNAVAHMKLQRKLIFGYHIIPDPDMTRAFGHIRDIYK